MDDGWLHPLAESLPSLVSNLWWNIIMDDWNLDENHSIGINNCNNVNLQSLKFCLQGLTNNVGLTISVGDIAPWFTISIKKALRIGDTKYHI